MGVQDVRDVHIANMTTLRRQKNRLQMDIAGGSRTRSFCNRLMMASKAAKRWSWNRSESAVSRLWPIMSAWKWTKYTDSPTASFSFAMTKKAHCQPEMVRDGYEAFRLHGG
jgi:hypothetical protein